MNSWKSTLLSAWTPAILPRWWSDVVAGQIRRDLGASVLVGMFYGFVFTFIPLVVAWQATHKAVSWPWKIVSLLAAVAIATPNLLTAGIVFGSTESAHAGQRTLSVDAGFFEAAIDRIGPEWHSLSKAAKDLGSAAVLLSILLCVGVWLAALWQRFI